jgi:DNA-binding GntR family transcriptional regulator
MIRREKVSRAVAQHLVRMLVTGQLRGGDRIDLEVVAAELGVSRAPVREALLQLEHDGVVESRYHRGVFAARFDAGAVRDHYELYGQLSGFASARVAEMGIPSVLATLEEQLAALHDGGTEHYEARSQAFMRSIHQGARSPRVVVLIRSFSTFVPESFHVVELTPWRVAEMVEALAQLMAALRAGAPERARAATLANVRYVGEAVVAALDERGIFDVVAGP